MSIELSKEAWIALGCLAGVVLLSAAVLWAAWRRGMRSQRKAPPPANNEGPSFTRTWTKEDEQFAELARRAEALRAPRQDQPKDRPPQA